MDLTGKKRKALIGFLLFLVILIIVLGWWEFSAYEPSPEALEYLKGGETVSVERNGWIFFEPESGSEKGFIFYPGAHVKPESYAPLAYRISKEGYQVVVVPMPFDLAIFGSGKASQVIDKYKNIESWIVGGHSLGGAMAARFADSNSDQVEGLILLAAYPPEGENLAGDVLEVLSIYGSRDGVLNWDKLISRKGLLPSDTDFFVIDGGNHAQFGNYGKQEGDEVATISRLEQQSLTAEKIVNFLENKIVSKI